MIYKRGDIYWFRFKWHGQILRESTKQGNDRIARQMESTRKADLIRDEHTRSAAQRKLETKNVVQCAECEKWFKGENAIAEGTNKFCSADCLNKFELRHTRVLTLSEFLAQKFLPYIESNLEKPKSRLYYGYGASMLAKSDLGKLRIDRITGEQVSEFKGTLDKKKLSTQNCALRTLRRALRLAVEWGKLMKAPQFPIDSKNEATRKRFITLEEFAAYIELCRQPWRDIAIVLYRTGARPSEIYGLTWPQVAFGNAGRPGRIEILEGKTEAAKRTLEMLPEVEEVLFNRWEAQRKPRRGFVFPADSASGHTEQTAAKICHADALKKLARVKASYDAWEKSGRNGSWFTVVAETTKLSHDYLRRHEGVLTEGFEHFCPYSLRHSFLTMLATSGADVFSVMRFAGHSSVVVTQRYIKKTDTAITRAFTEMRQQKFLEQAEGGHKRGHSAEAAMEGKKLELVATAESPGG